MTNPRADANYRQRLIQALAVVMARDGFAGAKIQDVVKEARVSLRTFYAEFPNKEACFLELVRQQTSVLINVIGEDLDFEQPWRDVMRQAFDVYFRALEAYPRLTHAILIEMASLSEEARVARQDGLDGYVERIIELVERGRAANPDIPSRPLSPLMARAILGGVTEMTVNRVVRGETDKLPELVDTATDMLWSVVTNVPATAPAGS